MSSSSLGETFNHISTGHKLFISSDYQFNLNPLYEVII